MIELIINLLNKRIIKNGNTLVCMFKTLTRSSFRQDIVSTFMEQECINVRTKEPEMQAYRLLVVMQVLEIIKSVSQYENLTKTNTPLNSKLIIISSLFSINQKKYPLILFLFFFLFTEKQSNRIIIYLFLGGESISQFFCVLQVLM